MCGWAQERGTRRRVDDIRPEQIITRLREAGVAQAQGQTVAQVCKAIEVTEQS